MFHWNSNMSTSWWHNDKSVFTPPTDIVSAPSTNICNFSFSKMFSCPYWPHLKVEHKAFSRREEENTVNHTNEDNSWQLRAVSLQTFVVLKSVVYSQSDGHSCVKKRKESLRTHFHAPAKLLCEVAVYFSLNVSENTKIIRSEMWRLRDFQTLLCENPLTQITLSVTLYCL